MNGAECLLRTLVAQGVELCLMNPGTSEMQFVAALDRVPEMRAVLCLFEGVCAGAADGYARMLDRPAATLLHLGPGLANGLANFHNARKARSPVVSIVGEHTTEHRRHDAPLTADIAGIARAVSGWVEVVPDAGAMGRLAAEAVRASYAGQIATLIVPADLSWSEAGEPQVQRRRAAPPQATGLPHKPFGPKTGLVLGGRALRAEALEAAGRIAEDTGARVFADRFAARMERGPDVFAPVRIPYFPEKAEPLFAGLEDLVLVEAPVPVSFFGYPGRRSTLAPEGCRMHVMGVEELITFGRRKRLPHHFARPAVVEGPLTVEAVGRALGALIPDGAIVSDEMVSSGERVWPWLAAVRHDHLPVTGGSIGQGLPVALGAALACPERKVVALEADGSAMYTLQALWTMARERLDVTAVIFANRRYRILDIEMQRTGAAGIGPRAEAMIDLSQPDLDFVKLAEAQGVFATRASSAHEFAAQFRDAMRERGPRLIEAVTC